MSFKNLRTALGGNKPFPIPLKREATGKERRRIWTEGGKANRKRKAKRGERDYGNTPRGRCLFRRGEIQRDIPDRLGDAKRRRWLLQRPEIFEKSKKRGSETRRVLAGRF